MDAYLAGMLTLIESNQPKVMLGIEATGLLTPLRRFSLPWEIGACKRYSDGGILPFTAVLDWGAPLPAEANPRHLDPRLPQLAGQVFWALLHQARTTL